MTGVRRSWFGALIVAGLMGGGFVRAEPAPPAWLQEISTALEGPSTHVVALVQGQNDKRLGLTHPLSPQSCVTLPVSEPWTLTVEVRFEPRRTYRLLVMTGLRPEGVDAYPPILQAAAHSSRCVLPKSGNSVLQVGRVWLAFPSVCRDIYPHEHALPRVVAVLQEKLGKNVSKELIWGGCGWVEPVQLTPLANFLAAKGKRVHKQDDGRLRLGRYDP
jgi:hypothetical protein